MSVLVTSTSRSYVSLLVLVLFLFPLIATSSSTTTPQSVDTAAAELSTSVFQNASEATTEEAEEDACGYSGWGEWGACDVVQVGECMQARIRTPAVQECAIQSDYKGCDPQECAGETETERRSFPLSSAFRCY
jgi:hypothetical protein